MTTVMRRRMPGMTGQAGSMARQLAGVIGGAVVYAVIRWGLLPSVNPLMAFYKSGSAAGAQSSRPFGH